MTCIGKFNGKWDGAIKNTLTPIKNINRYATLINSSCDSAPDSPFTGWKAESIIVKIPW